MYGPDSVYALDIETLNDAARGFHGLIPARSRITEVAVSTADGGMVFNDEDELALLISLEAFLAELRPGLISTWNGAVFDLPFITDRFANYPVTHGWNLTADPQIVPKYDPLPGHVGGYSAYWLATGTHHAHLDVSHYYKRLASRAGVKHSLKPVCGALGIDMVEIDRENLHLYTPRERSEYALSDGYGTRQLALHQLGWIELPGAA